MCGVCGWVGKGSALVEEAGRDAVARMQTALAHRGPDDEGLLAKGQAALGFRRLSIIDIQQGHQPMTSEDGHVWSVVNGEIYNFRELRRELIGRGHRFQSHTDSEVIPHLYEEHGIDGLRRLRGMFAIAIYDERQDILYLARDYFGIKPLYYGSTPSGVFFSSEVRSLLQSGSIPGHVDPVSLWHYLTYQYVPDPRTMIQDVFKVPAAHYVRVQSGQVSVHPYWDLRFEPDPSLSLEAAVESIRTVLEDSVAAHLASDVPVGAYLSSGVDSSAIVALMRRHQEVNTFSIGFEDATLDHDELRWARTTAELLNTHHHELRVSAQQYCDAWPTIAGAQDDPVADPSALALWFLAREARKEVTVVLSGEGADELFGGYPIYHEPLSLEPFERLPRAVRKALNVASQYLPHGLKGKSFLERGSQPLPERFIGNAKIFRDREKPALLQSTAGFLASHPSHGVAAPIYDATTHLDPTTRMQSVDLKLWLPGDILSKADKMSMAHSLELRVPFLDIEVFQVARQIPVRHRLHGHTTKFALRRAADAWLPKDITDRPKLGFPVPYRQWLTHQLRDFARDVVESSQAPHVNFRAVRKLLDDLDQKGSEHARKVWTILTYLLWHRAVLEPPGHQP